MDGQFEELLAQWQDKLGSVIPLLQRTQDIYGYLSREAMERIAGVLGASPAEIYGVATFYAQFRFQQRGRHTVKVCHGTACHVNGAAGLDTAVNTELGVEVGQTTEDGRFTVETVACLGCCSLSPVAMIDNEVHGQLNGDKLRKTLRKVTD